MKFVEKIDLIVKLKEKIAEAEVTNTPLATQLQSLLDQIISTPETSPAI
ncbi:MAG: hypothetical protein AB7S65_02345 [Sulfuricurvum sp.]